MSKTIWITQNASGADTGADAANAHSAQWLNDNQGVGAGKVNAGDTIMLSGTITMGFWVIGGIDAAHPTVCQFDTNAKMSAPSWPTGAIIVYETSFVTIDGGTNGVIEATANGTLLANKTACYGIKADAGSYLTVKNLAFNNLYVRTSIDDLTAGSDSVAIYNRDANGIGISHFTVTNCTGHDFYTGVQMDYGATGGSDYTVQGCTFYNCNWGAICGDRGDGSIFTGTFLFKGNTIYGFTAWDDTQPGFQNHHDALYFWCHGASSSATNIICDSNVFGPGLGNAGIGGNMNTCVFIDLQQGNTQVINNVFRATDGEYPGNSYIEIAINSGTALVANNTINGGALTQGGGINAYATTLDIYNNVVVNTKNWITVDADSTLTSNNNIFYTTNYGTAFKRGATFYSSLAAWQAAGFDSSGQDVDPLFTNPTSYDFGLQESSPARSAGLNLTSSFTTDAANSARPSTGPWDVGAYQYNGNVVGAPSFSPVAGTYSNEQAVTIFSPTAGASIRYTMDGGTPTDSVGTIYSGAFSLAASATVKAIAYKSGMTNSSVASSAFTITAAPQVFTSLTVTTLQFA